MCKCNFRLLSALFVFPAIGWTPGGHSTQPSGSESGARSGTNFGLQDQLVELTPVASAGAPLSFGGDIALPTEGLACVIESYDYRVHCIPRDGGRTSVFGRRGQGPGEFPSAPSSIIRGPGGTIGVVATARRRMSVFEPSGDWVFDVRLPSRLRPSAPFDSVLPSEDINWTGEVWGNRHLDVDVQPRVRRFRARAPPGGGVRRARLDAGGARRPAGRSQGPGWLPGPGNRLVRHRRAQVRVGSGTRRSRSSPVSISAVSTRKPGRWLPAARKVAQPKSSGPITDEVRPQKA